MACGSRFMLSVYRVRVFVLSVLRPKDLFEAVKVRVRVRVRVQVKVRVRVRVFVLSV